jgi:ribose transport system substrate-binding protein
METAMKKALTALALSTATLVAFTAGRRQELSKLKIGMSFQEMNNPISSR